VFELNEAAQKISTHYQWASSDIEQEGHIFTNLSEEAYQWILHQLYEDGVVSFYDIEELPQESDNIQEILGQQSIQSFMVAGLFYQDHITAILGLATTNKQGDWSSETISLLNTSGEVFYRAIKRNKPKSVSKKVKGNTAHWLKT
jgi:GAF domain-containing protein